MREKKSKRSRADRSVGIKYYRTLRFAFAGAVCILLAASGAITFLTFILFDAFGLFDISGINSIFLIVSLVAVCTVLGTALSGITGKFILARVSRISDGMRRIAKGDYKTRVKELDKPTSPPSEFGELERAFNQMAAELDGIELFRNDFINDFSHEFKTPIVSIRGFARQLRTDNLTEEQRREYLDIIITQSERLANMSSNILLLNKLENQQIVSDVEEFYLDEQIRRAILLLEKEWAAKDIELDIDLEEIKFSFNEEMLLQVWINLLSNAVKFTPEGGRVACELKRADGNVVFTVTDSGVGMSPEEQGRIFEKFYQGDLSHSVSGNGIGLNIVKRIVTLAKGRIELESTLGEGSRFSVILPIAR